MAIVLANVDKIVDSNNNELIVAEANKSSAGTLSIEAGAPISKYQTVALGTDNKAYPFKLSASNELWDADLEYHVANGKNATLYNFRYTEGMYNQTNGKGYSLFGTRQDTPNRSTWNGSNYTSNPQYEYDSACIITDSNSQVSSVVPVTFPTGMVLHKIYRLYRISPNEYLILYVYWLNPEPVDMHSECNLNLALSKLTLSDNGITVSNTVKLDATARAKTEGYSTMTASIAHLFDNELNGDIFVHGSGSSKKICVVYWEGVTTGYNTTKFFDFNTFAETFTRTYAVMTGNATSKKVFFGTNESVPTSIFVNSFVGTSSGNWYHIAELRATDGAHIGTTSGNDPFGYHEFKFTHEYVSEDKRFSYARGAGGGWHYISNGRTLNSIRNYTLSSNTYAVLGKDQNTYSATGIVDVGFYNNDFFFIHSGSLSDTRPNKALIRKRFKRDPSNPLLGLHHYDSYSLDIYNSMSLIGSSFDEANNRINLIFQCFNTKSIANFGIDLKTIADPTDQNNSSVGAYEGNLFDIDSYDRILGIANTSANSGDPVEVNILAGIVEDTSRTFESVIYANGVGEIDFVEREIGTGGKNELFKSKAIGKKLSDHKFVITNV